MSELPVFGARSGVIELPLEPPFRSIGLGSRYFPLRADLGRLRAFCQRYLNHLPEAGRFLPRLPYVLLMDCTHRRLQTQADGWFSQKEVALGFPVEWQQHRDGRWQFQGLAFVNAFVFLDNPLGLSTGREVHGWPKALAEITDEGAVTVVADDGSGRLRPKPLLAIERAPWQPLHAFAPGRLASQLRAWMGMLSGEVQSLAQGPGDVGPLLSRWRAYLVPDLSTDIITLKQFRDVEQPSRSAYQAVIHSVMEAQRLKDLRLLAPLETAWGDLSGGFRVRFHETASYPIVDMLGIEVEPAGTGVFSARPTVPFALDLDIRYGAGRVLGERREDRPAPYVEISAGSLEALPGPLTANELVLHVLVMPADGGALAAVCEELQMMGAARDLRPADRAVHLLVASGQMSHQGQPACRGPIRFAGLYLPVVHDGRQEWLAPFEFVDGGVWGTTGRELYGANLAIGKLSGAWVESEVAGAEGTTLFTLTTHSLPGREQQQSRQVRLLQIEAGPGAGARVGGSVAMVDGPARAQRLVVLGLRQYRDAALRGRACYQAIIRRPIAVKLDAAQAGAPVTVRFQDDASFPLARKLGLPVEVMATAYRMSAVVQLEGASVVQPATHSAAQPPGPITSAAS